MARYIKANPKVAAFLNLEDTRNQLQDGNYLLWQADMLELGSLVNLPDILDTIGGIALSSREAREEQDGTMLRPLPAATDPRFICTPSQNPQNAGPSSEPEPGENAPETGDNEPDGQSISPESESPSEDEGAVPAGEEGDGAGSGSDNEPANTEEE